MRARGWAGLSPCVPGAGRLRDLGAALPPPVVGPDAGRSRGGSSLQPPLTTRLSAQAHAGLPKGQPHNTQCTGSLPGERPWGRAQLAGTGLSRPLAGPGGSPLSGGGGVLGAALFRLPGAALLAREASAGTDVGSKAIDVESTNAD